MNYSPFSPTPCIKCNLFSNFAALARLASRLPHPWGSSPVWLGSPCQTQLGAQGTSLRPLCARSLTGSGSVAWVGLVVKAPLMSFGGRSPEGGGSSVRWLLCVSARHPASFCSALSLSGVQHLHPCGHDWGSGPRREKLRCDPSNCPLPCLASCLLLPLPLPLHDPTGLPAFVSISGERGAATRRAAPQKLGSAGQPRSR